MVKAERPLSVQLGDPRGDAQERARSADSGRSATVGKFVGIGTPKLSFKFSIGMAHRDPKPPFGAQGLKFSE